MALSFRSLVRALVLPVFLLSAALCGLTQGNGKDDWSVPEEAKKVKNPVSVTEAGVAAASVLYAENCAQCHGETGKGDGPMAEMSSPKPADFSDAHRMREMTDGEIFYKIGEGRMPMLSFKKKFSEEQRWQLVHLIRTFARRPAPEAKTPPPGPKKAPPAKKPDLSYKR